MPCTAPVVLSLLAQLQTAPATTTAPGTGPATVQTRPATATAPAAPKLVRWHGEYDKAAAEAKKSGRLLLLIYYDPDAPASQSLEEMTLSDRRTREFLSAFAAVRLNATQGPGKKRFAKTGAAEAPLTQVFSPKGELLDFRPGCIIPASAFRQRLTNSLEYWAATQARPFNAAARWKAVRARMKLATREKAAPEIDKLLKLPAGKLPQAVTPALLHLTKGKALSLAKPKRAEESLGKARALAPDDAALAGEAMLLLAEMHFRSGRHAEAHDLCGAYIKKFPKAAGIGRAYYAKAMVELLGLKDRPAARKTLEEFLETYPGHLGVVKAKDLLDAIEQEEKKEPSK